MADFRKALYAVALVTLIVGITVPASAQSTPTCNVFSPNSIMRAESFTDVMGDLLVQCTGGTPTAAGQPVPAVTLTVFTDAPVTSKITDVTSAGLTQAPFTEALAIIDEPNSSFAFSAASPALRNRLLACGSTGGAQLAAYDQNSLGVCSIISDGVATNTYNGITGHPNVFQGRVLPNTGGTGIQFVGVPIDPPGVGATLLIRITNIRINSVAVTGGNVGNANSGLVHATIGATTPNSLSFLNNTVQTATIRNGLLSIAGTTNGPYPQCGPTFGAGGAITLVEGFPSAWKTKNWAQMQGNGAPNLASDWQYQNTFNNPPDLNQNVPGAFYATESGFMYPGSSTPGAGNLDPTPLNAPVGTAPVPGTATAINLVTPSTPFGSTATGLSLAGTVSNGTRFVFVFNNIPIGANASVPAAVLLQNAQSNAVINTGVMVNVAGADANGAGGSLNTTTVTRLSETGPTVVIYEVLFANFIAIEKVSVSVSIAPTINLGANPPVNGSPQIAGPNGLAVAVGQAGFAPFYAPGATPNPGLTQPLYPATNGLPIPRFVNNLSANFTLFSFTKCACDLMFPWVVGDSTFTTSIVVDNASKDPGAPFSFTASAQTGRVTFWYYGTKGIDVSGGGAANTATNLVDATYIPQQTTILIPAGSYVATVVSPFMQGDTTDKAIGTGKGNGITKLPGAFAGYVIAQSEFRYCHGIAAITSSLPGFGTQTYVGLVMDNGNIFNGLGGQLPARTSNLGENFEQ